MTVVVQGENLAVSLRDLQFEWQPGRLILDIPSLEITRGARVFLRGPSGSGKSTLLGLMAGILRAQHGQISVLGTDLGMLTGAQRDAFRARDIGFIFQMFNLVPYLSVLENVLLPTRFSAARLARIGPPVPEALRLLAALGLEEPDLNRRGSATLSVGQQQRVAAARALIGRPALVIADEPTSALDADARDLFLDLLMRECRAVEATLVFVSHDRSLQPHFDATIDLPFLNRAHPATAA